MLAWDPSVVQYCNNADTTQKKPTPSILELPKEIRNRIWHFVMRPDCMFLTGPNSCLKQHGHRGHSIHRLNVLVLCSTVYNETVVLLRNNGEVVVPLRYRGQPLFDSPDNLRSSYSANGSLPLVPKIQFLSLRKIALLIKLPQVNRKYKPYRDPWNKIHSQCSVKNKLRDILQALKEMNDIRSLRLLMDRRSEDINAADDWRKHSELDRKMNLPRLLLAIVKEAATKGAEITVGRAFHYIDHATFSQLLSGAPPPVESHDDDPIVPWLLQAALDAGIHAIRPADVPLKKSLRKEDLWSLIRPRTPYMSDVGR